MEIYYLALIFCVLFKTYTSTSSVDAIPRPANDSLALNAEGEACDCGPNSRSCSFSNGVKQCLCNDIYADRYGTCEECDCGPYSSYCNFNNNQKTCGCLEDHVQKGEKCEPACGFHYFCKNGGYCKDGFCWCRKGTSGEFCEVVDGCPHLCPIREDVECFYNPFYETTACVCDDHRKSYDPLTTECKNTCKTDYQCVNGVCRNGVCECVPGTFGDWCEIVDCDTDVVTCNQMDLLFKGGDVLYVLKEGKLLKFVRQEYAPSHVHCLHGTPVKCNYRHDVLWCDGHSVFVPTSDNKAFRYLLTDSTGARCSGSSGSSEEINS